MGLQNVTEQEKGLNTAPAFTVEQHHQVSDNPWMREAQLGVAAVASVPQALNEAFTDHLGSTLTKMGTAGAVSFALRCASRQPTLGAITGRVVLPALALGFVTDVVLNGGKIAYAVVDNFDSADDWDKNVDVMKNSFGRFAVDLGVSSVGGGIGEIAGARVFGLRAPGVKSLPELNSENIAKHIEESPGTLQPYQFFSKDGGGRRQVDVFIPKGTTTDQSKDLLVGIDSLIINKKPGMAMTNGLANTKMDPDIDYIAAFPHAKTFRLLPGVNVSTWFNDRAGLIKPGGWFAPVAKYDDAALIGDVRGKLGEIFPNLGRTTLAGFSTGGTMALESAARMGKSVQAVVGVESTITGAETPAVTGQMRLFSHGTENTTFPIAGGAGKTTKLLTILGHDRVNGSQPLGQIDYSLKPYRDAGVPIVETSTTLGNTQRTMFQPENGEPVLFVKLEGGKNAWPNRSVGNPDDKSVLTGLNGVSEFPELNLNGMIKKVVHGQVGLE